MLGGGKFVSLACFVERLMNDEGFPGVNKQFKGTVVNLKIVSLACVVERLTNEKGFPGVNKQIPLFKGSVHKFEICYFCLSC